MFQLQPPRLVQPDVFSALPAELRRRNERSPWADANKAGARIDSFLEGPVFDRDGNLFVADIPFGRVLRVSAAGEWSVLAQYEGEPNGLKFHPDGDLVVADYRLGLLRADPVSGRVQPWLPRRHSESFKGLNDLFFAPSGNLYVTDQGQTGLHDPTGRVYRVSPDGRLQLLLHNVPSPNGVVVTPDERVLYLAVTRANAVWRCPLMDDGSVSKAGAFFTFNGIGGPDGLALDRAGRLYVARGDYVAVLSPRGEVEVLVRAAPEQLMTNLALREVAGGQELTITESAGGNLLRARV